MRRFFFILIIFLSTYGCFAAGDSTAVTVRSFNSAALQSIKSDEAFQYDQSKQPALSWWDKFWMWFWWKVEQILQTKSGRATVWTVFILMGVIVIGYAVFKIKKMNRGGLFASNSGAGLDYSVGHEDIHQISFDAAIEEAITHKNYRLAVRLLYLQTLKKFADKNIINWKINKTNSDYVKEVSERPWQSLFNQLTYQFEYAWYGETNVNADKFEALRQAFKQLNNQV